MAFKNASRFFARNSAGKYQLDVNQLRASFVGSEAVSNQMRNFHSERVARLAAGESPIHLRGVPSMVVHIMPFAAFNPSGARPDFSVLDKSHAEVWPLCNSSGADMRFNLDGWLMFSKGSGYTQYYRSGVIEGVNATWIDEKTISHRAIQDGLVKFSRGSLATLKALNLEGPFTLWVTLIGTKGRKLSLASFDYPDADINTVDRDQLFFEPIYSDSLSVSPVIFLKPIFEALWQSAGWEKCFEYDRMTK